MAEFILKDWYGKEQTFDKETIYVQGKDGELMPFTHGAKAVIEPLTVTKNGTYTAPAGVVGYSPVTVNVSADTEEMVYYRGLAEALMNRNAEYHSGDAAKMNMKGFVMSDGRTLASLNSYSFAGFRTVEAMSFSDVLMIYENAFLSCTALKIIDITVSEAAPSIAAFNGFLNGCPNVESIIIRASDKGLTVANIPQNHGGGDNFYVYIPSAYYDAVTANLPSTALPKSRYRKLEDYPEVDKWNETNI